ncbi:MAG: hypothetical protein D8M61_20785 [Ignavibacteriae bacterium]|nr:hypothetical protein [Ignavibacteriota bacterium]
MCHKHMFLKEAIVQILPVHRSGKFVGFWTKDLGSIKAPRGRSGFEQIKQFLARIQSLVPIRIENHIANFFFKI